jgi:hypothetical protein
MWEAQSLRFHNHNFDPKLNKMYDYREFEMKR